VVYCIYLYIGHLLSIYEVYDVYVNWILLMYCWFADYVWNFWWSWTWDNSSFLLSFFVV